MRYPVLSFPSFLLPSYESSVFTDGFSQPFSTVSLSNVLLNLEFEHQSEHALFLMEEHIACRLSLVLYMTVRQVTLV